MFISVEMCQVRTASQKANSGSIFVIRLCKKVTLDFPILLLMTSFI
jgi:hypothetical protein